MELAQCKGEVLVEYLDSGQSGVDGRERAVVGEVFGERDLHTVGGGCCVAVVGLRAGYLEAVALGKLKVLVGKSRLVEYEAVVFGYGELGVGVLFTGCEPEHCGRASKKYRKFFHCFFLYQVIW